MNYYINLFSPETVSVFAKSNRKISGFRISKKTYVENQKIGPGDRFICYCTKVQRFIGVLEIKSKAFVDDKPLYAETDDPFILRFEVEPVIWLDIQKSIPLHDAAIWNNLSFTEGLSHDSNKWNYMVFSSPRLWPRSDCEFLEKTLIAQGQSLTEYPFSEYDEKKLKIPRIRISSKKVVSVSVPDDEEEEKTNNQIFESIVAEQRESIKVQAKLSEIGEKLGFKIWIPKNDRKGILELWKPKNESLLEELPLVFDETTLKTIRNIDVLWIKRRSIVRAFEVEDTTSIYSGILRMADLLSLQPMLDIKIHIVAPISRRELVFQQIRRPVFAVMEKGPLSELCSYISYDSVFEIVNERRLEYMTDNIINDYVEFAES